MVSSFVVCLSQQSCLVVGSSSSAHCCPMPFPLCRRYPPFCPSLVPIYIKTTSTPFSHTYLTSLCYYFLAYFFLLLKMAVVGAEEEKKVGVPASELFEGSDVVGDLDGPQRKALDELKELVRVALANHEFNKVTPIKDEEKKQEEVKKESAKDEEEKEGAIKVEETKKEEAIEQEEAKREDNIKEEEPKKEEDMKQEETKMEEVIKQEATKKEEAIKQDESKKEEIKKSEEVIKQEELKKEEEKKAEEPKKEEALKQEESKKEAPIKLEEAKKEESSKPEEAKKESTVKPEEPKKEEAIKPEEHKKEETTQQEEFKKEEATKLEEPKKTEEPTKPGEQQNSKVEEPEKEEATKSEEPNKPEDSKIEEKPPQEVFLYGIPLLGHLKSDTILLKFLRARDFNPSHALAMLKSTHQWRKSFDTDHLLHQDLSLPELHKVVFTHGVSKQGYPVCYNAYGEFQDKELYDKVFGEKGGFLRWRVQFLEKGIREMLEKENGDGKCAFVQVTDLKNSPGPAKKELRQATSQALALLQDNYPEFVAKQVFINVPWWYLAFNKMVSPFLTQRSKSKFVFAGPSKSPETLFKYIAPEQVPVQYGGLSSDNNTEFSMSDAATEVVVKPSSKHTIEFPVSKACTLVWELRVLGWEVSYGAEYVPDAEESYTVIVQKSRKYMSTDEPVVKNNFKIGEPGKIVITVENTTSKKKKLLYRSKTETSTGSV